MQSESNEEYEDFLKKLIKRLEVAQQNTPKGRLKILMKGGHYEYYFCEEGAGSSRVPAKYLSKTEDTLIRALVQKEYDKNHNDCVNNIKNLHRLCLV